MINNVPKWWETIKITLAKYAAYRSNFILIFLAPSIVAFFIKFYLWSSIYEGHSSGQINGYSLHEMISYHIWALIISFIAQGHSSIDLAMEIRHGKISSYLIYPFNFWEFHTAAFLAFEMIQIATAIITVGIVTMMGVIDLPGLETLLQGFAYCMLVGFFWFALQFLAGICAFWLEDTWTLRVLAQIIVIFLSGSMIPLDFFPPWLKDILDYTPFPFMTYYPIKIFMGESVPLLKGVSLLSIWMVVIVALNGLIWRKGIRIYTAAGM